MSAQLFEQLSRSARAASENRRLLDAAGAVCLNLIGPLGAGKTTLLSAVAPRLCDKLRVALVRAGPLGAYDAGRTPAGVPTVAAGIGGGARFTALDLRAALDRLDLPALDLVLVENTGALTAQTGTDLGEHVRVVLLSVPDGRAVLVCHPTMLHDAGMVVLTKYDLAATARVDLAQLVHQVRRSNPRAEVICTDTEGRVGVDRLAGWLLGYVRAQRFRPPKPAWELEPAGLPN